MIYDDPPKPAERFADQLVQSARDVANAEPSKAVAIAFGVGLMIHFLPTRFIASSVATAATAIARPTLMTLGVIKAFEIYTDRRKPN